MPGGGPAPTAADNGRDDGEGEDRRHGLDIKVALIGAVATILAAVIAAVVAVSANAVEISFPEGGPSRDDLSDTVTSLEQANDALEDEKADLQQELDQASARRNVPTTSPRPPGPAGDVAREGKALPLVSRHGFDLDSAAGDWGVAGDPGELDIYIDYAGGLFLAGRNGAQVAVMPNVPSFVDCQQATGLKDGLSRDETAPGTQLCVRTTKGAYAYVGIVSVDVATDSVTVDVTHWE